MGIFSKLFSKGNQSTSSKPSKLCSNEHQWVSDGCKKNCTACGAIEGNHDFQKKGNQYGRSGVMGMYQDYKCTKCKYEVKMKVSNSAGINSLQAEHFMDFASILGVGPERELNKVVGNPPKEVAFNSDLLK